MEDQHELDHCHRDEQNRGRLQREQIRQCGQKIIEKTEYSEIPQNEAQK